MNQIENTTWNNSFKLGLKDWRTYLIFTPGIIGMLLISTLPVGEIGIPQIAMGNLLLVLYFLLLSSVQAFLLFTFLKRIGKQWIFFGVNAGIPVLFFFLYFLFVLYRFFFTVAATPSATNGPIRVENLQLRGLIIYALMIHATITFFFINNRVVANLIKGEPNQAAQLELSSHFHRPMRNLVKGSLILFLVMFVFTIFYDILGLL